MRKRKRYKYEESALKPNVDLEIDDIADYQRVIKKQRGQGYKGLEAAFTNRSVVKLVVQKDDSDNEEVTGTISHYDDKFSQLVVITGNSLKRLTFDQIIDVTLLNGGEQSEELSD